MKARLAELGFKSYDAYLRSALWRDNKRRLNLPKTCYVCSHNKKLKVKGAKGRIMHAHHRTYANLGCEKRGDLVVLCKWHHEALHRFLKTHNITLFEAHEKYLQQQMGKRFPLKKKKRVRKPKK